MAVVGKFTQVKERVQSHPQEARYRHPRGYTTLHCCAEYGAPLDVVQAVYNACPKAIHVKDYEGRTPIEAAVLDEIKEFLQTISADNKIDKTNNDGDATVVLAQHSDANQILSHISTLSNHVKSLTSTCDNMRTEIDALKSALKDNATK